MGGGSGGSGSGGRSGGGGGGATLVEGGVTISANMTGDQIAAAHTSIIERTKGNDAEYDTAMKSFVSRMKQVGVTEAALAAKGDSYGAGKVRRFLKKYG